MDYKMERHEGRVKCCIERILMEAMMLSMESQIKGNLFVAIHSQRPFVLR